MRTRPSTATARLVGPPIPARSPPGWRWISASRRPIGRAVIEQAYPELNRVRKFAIEYWQDGQWKPCYRGENLGASLDATFEPVIAQRVRLNITEATDGPTIWEFELFPPKK